ncbi:MAG: TolC family outer membrane protein [Pseudomonadota bacterium]
MRYINQNNNKNMYRFIAIVSLSFLFPIGQVHAESLKEALGVAYLRNPTLNAQRANLRSVDETVPIAISGYRPSITASGDVTYTDTTNPFADVSSVGGGGSSTGSTDIESQSYSITLSQPIFRSGRVTNAVKEAKANVYASREDLRDVEQTTLLNSVTSYNDVVRDQSIVRLRQNNVKVLTKQKDATQDRFNVGEVTRTDVAQSVARRSGAVSDLSLAKGNLKTSQATYQQIIGTYPTKLRKPGSITFILPKNLNEAIDMGLLNNPDVIAAKFREKSADFSVKKNVAELLPELNLEASYSKDFSSIDSQDNIETTTVSGRLTVPLYQSGSVSASIRQAKQLRDQARRQVQEAVAQVRAEVISAWSNLQASRAQLKSDKVQVQSNKTALNGVREEEKVGQRTILDVLDAEQELLDSQVNLSTTQRNLSVAEYTLLSAIGRLTAIDLGLDVPLYDEKAYYKNVKYKFFGFGSNGKKNYTRKKNP